MQECIQYYISSKFNNQRCGRQGTSTTKILEFQLLNIYVSIYREIKQNPGFKFNYNFDIMRTYVADGTTENKKKFRKYFAISYHG